jgi:hypothetical protein
MTGDKFLAQGRHSKACVYPMWIESHQVLHSALHVDICRVRREPLVGRLEKLFAESSRHQADVLARLSAGICGHTAMKVCREHDSSTVSRVVDRALMLHFAAKPPNVLTGESAAIEATQPAIEPSRIPIADTDGRIVGLERGANVRYRHRTVQCEDFEAGIESRSNLSNQKFHRRQHAQLLAQIHNFRRATEESTLRDVM